MIARATLPEARDKYIPQRLEFRTSNKSFSGKVSDQSLYMGRLNKEDAKTLRNLLANERVYVVISWATPIAWYANDEWYVVDQKFSVSTNRHQSTVRAAIA